MMIVLQLILFCALFTLMVKIGVGDNARNGGYTLCADMAAGLEKKGDPDCNMAFRRCDSCGDCENFMN